MTFGPRTPTLLYDGDCTFCRAWVEYWRKCTGPVVLYVPYQEAGKEHPEVEPAAAARAVHFIDAEGVVTAGAAAVCKLLSHVPGNAWLLWAYRHVPGFAFVSELAYRLIASHRPLAMAVTRALWGKRPEPPTYAYAHWLYLRAVSALFLIFFFSTALQMPGLVGGAGILPASSLLSAASESFGAERYLLFPTLTWLGSGDLALQMIAFVGGMSALAALVGILTLPALAIGLVCALSLIVAGQTFFAFQWDALLMEVGFLALLLAPRTLRETGRLRSMSRAMRWLLWLLLFRVMWSSGIVKVLAGSSPWQDLTAVSYHYFTQPLPNPLSWFMEGLPMVIHRLTTISALTVELVVPFLLFLPRRIRFIGAAFMVAFQFLVGATGNFALYNLEVAALCLTCFDDQWYRQFLPRKLREKETESVTAPFSASSLARFWRITKGFGLAMLFAGNAVLLVAVVRGEFRPMGIVGSAFTAVAPFRILNPYGAFAVMTTNRQEVIIEGSDDGMDWKEYQFSHKPGDVRRLPTAIAPHDPRLDWQLWFVPFGEATDSPWFLNLMMRLLQGTPEVTSLLAENPFPRDPPRYLRVSLYEYRFTTREEHMVDGAWWHRTFVRMYVPITSLETMPILYRQAAKKR